MGMHSAASLSVLLVVCFCMVVTGTAEGRGTAMSQQDARRWCEANGGRLPFVHELLARQDALRQTVKADAGEESYWFWSLRTFRYNSTEQFAVAVDVRDGSVFRRYRTNHLSVYCISRGSVSER